MSAKLEVAGERGEAKEELPTKRNDSPSLITCTPTKIIKSCTVLGMRESLYEADTKQWSTVEPRDIETTIHACMLAFETT